MKLFLSDDGSAGIAVKPDGDIVSVFKNVNISKAKASSDLLVTALENGGKKLDCYDGFLTKLYMKFGFIPVARVKFNREYAPDAWNYERDGEPDVIAFAHNGDSVDDILNGKWKDYKTYNPDDVPLLDDYDAVMAARDAYLGGDIKKGIGSDMLQKYPGGRWSTMNGRHVYIDKGGKIAPETDPKKGASVSDKAAKITEQGMKDIKVGSLYKFGRRTMVVDKVGRSYVYGQTKKVRK
jgi:hypothetical protein